MPPLYLLQQGAKISISNRRLRVEQEGEELLNVPMVHIDQVVIFGNVGLTTPAIATLLAHNLEVVFLSLHGEYRGRLMGSLNPHVPLRCAQYTCLNQPDFVLNMAAQMVRAKLLHQKALLQRHNRQIGDAEIEASIQHLDQALQEVERKTALPSLNGLEGSATAAYFRGFRRLFDASWRFEARRRQPPPDPVNVLLSLGYTLLAQIAHSAVQVVGLDPYAGFLHQIAYNRPALGLDVMEEFRPVVDGVVLWCCRSGAITLEHFTPGEAERPVVLSEAGLRLFIRAWEERLDQSFTHPKRGLKLPLRQCIIEQARQIAECVQQGRVDFQPMGFR